MISLSLLLALVTSSTPAFAGDAAGRLISAREAGIVVDAKGKLPGMLIRCAVATTPAGLPLEIHLPRAHAASFTAVLKGTLGWTEETFEQQRITLEARAGHACYTNHSSDNDVISAVRANHGAVGIVSATAALPEDVVVLWPLGVTTPAPAPASTPAAPAGSVPAQPAQDPPPSQPGAGR